MTITASDLAQFTGTENYYRHTLFTPIKYTDGVKYLAEEAGAYWLLDKVATNQLNPKIRREEFQSWKLRVGHNNTAVLTCDDGNGNIIHTEDITFTDFPLPEIDLWVEGGVILLPSEH